MGVYIAKLDLNAASLTGFVRFEEVCDEEALSGSCAHSHFRNNRPLLYCPPDHLTTAAGTIVVVVAGDSSDDGHFGLRKLLMSATIK